MNRAGRARSPAEQHHVERVALEQERARVRPRTPFASREEHVAQTGHIASCETLPCRVVGSHVRALEEGCTEALGCRVANTSHALAGANGWATGWLGELLREGKSLTEKLPLAIDARGALGNPRAQLAQQKAVAPAHFAASVRAADAAERVTRGGPRQGCRHPPSVPLPEHKMRHDEKCPSSSPCTSTGEENRSVKPRRVETPPLLPDCEGTSLTPNPLKKRCVLRGSSTCRRRVLS